MFLESLESSTESCELNYVNLEWCRRAFIIFEKVKLNREIRFKAFNAIPMYIVLKCDKFENTGALSRFMTV